MNTHALPLAGTTARATPATTRAGGASLPVKRGIATAAGDKDTPDGVRKAARQFESFFISYLFKVMKSTVPDSPFSGGSSQSEMYEDMFGAELGNRLAERGGLGLADYLEKNMTRSAGTTDAVPAPAAKTGKRGAFLDARPEAPRPKPIAVAVNTTAAEPDHTRTDVRLPVLSDRVAQALDLAADTAGVDRNLVRAVAIAESGGNPDAQSPAGARGLMQLMAATARELGVTKVFDPVQNALAGARYLKKMLIRHGGDVTLALASYNAGPGAVRRHGGVPPYKETVKYIDKVLSVRDALAGGADRPASAEEPT